MTHAPESGVEFMAPISGAGFWSVCRWLKSASLSMLYKIDDLTISVAPEAVAAIPI